MANEVKIRIRAENEASQTIGEVRDDVVQLSRDMEVGADGMTQAMRDAYARLDELAKGGASAGRTIPAAMDAATYSTTKLESATRSATTGMRGLASALSSGLVAVAVALAVKTIQTLVQAAQDAKARILAIMDEMRSERDRTIDELMELRGQNKNPIQVAQEVSVKLAAAGNTAELAARKEEADRLAKAADAQVEAARELRKAAENAVKQQPIKTGSPLVPAGVSPFIQGIKSLLSGTGTSKELTDAMNAENQAALAAARARKESEIYAAALDEVANKTKEATIAADEAARSAIEGAAERRAAAETELADRSAEIRAASAGGDAGMAALMLERAKAARQRSVELASGAAVAEVGPARDTMLQQAAEAALESLGLIAQAETATRAASAGDAAKQFVQNLSAGDLFARAYGGGITEDPQLTELEKQTELLKALVAGGGLA